MSTLPSLLQAADIVRIMGIGRNEYIATMVQVGGMDGWMGIRVCGVSVGAAGQLRLMHGCSCRHSGTPQQLK